MREQPTQADRHDRHIFICYSTADRRFADKLVAELNASGVSVWIDRFALKAGDSLLARIEAAITSAAYFIVILTPASVESEWVEAELEMVLTRQRAEGVPLVIPVLYKDCEIPPSLQDQRHVDFRRREKFKASLALLLDALGDEHLSRGDDAQPRKDAGTDFVEDLEDLLPDKKDPWFHDFRESPLTVMLRKSIQIGSFSGAFRDEVIAELALSGEARIGFFNAFVAIAAFLKQVKDRDLVRPDLLDFLLVLVQHRGLNVELRKLVLRALVGRYDSVKNRWQKDRLLPNIFPEQRFDSLADDLIAEHMGATATDLLGELWTRSTLPYRREIVAYVVRTSEWTKETGTIERLLVDDGAPDALRRRLGKSRKGPLEPGGVGAMIESLRKREGSTAGVDRGELLLLLETAARAREQGSFADSAAMVGFLFGGDTLDRFQGAYGDAGLFALLTTIIASPYFDPLTALLMMVELSRRFGLDALRHDDRFPACLLTPRDAGFVGLPKQTSVVQALVQGGATSGSDGVAYVILVGLLAHFKQGAFRGGVALALHETADLDEKRVDCLRGLLDGTCSHDAALAVIGVEG